MFSSRKIMKGTSAGLLCGTFFAAAAALTTGPSNLLAASKSYSGVGQGIMEKGREACLQDAIENGKKEALRNAMKAIGDGVYRPLIHNPIVADVQRYVKKHKASKAKYGVNGRCHVKVKARIDFSALEQAMNQALGNGTLVAVIVRYYVNGKLAGGAGANELEASNIASGSLQEFGCRTVSLHEHYKFFSRRLKPQWQAITGDDLEKEEPLTESDSEALARILRDLNDRLSAGGSKLAEGELLDLVLIGEVNVRDNGRDPDSARFMAEAKLGMSLHKLSTLEQFHSVELTEAGAGPSKVSAANTTLNAAMHHAANALHKKTPVCSLS